MKFNAHSKPGQCSPTLSVSLFCCYECSKVCQILQSSLSLYGPCLWPVGWTGSSSWQRKVLAGLVGNEHTVERRGWTGFGFYRRNGGSIFSIWFTSGNLEHCPQHSETGHTKEGMTSCWRQQWGQGRKQKYDGDSLIRLLILSQSNANRNGRLIFFLKKF